MEKHPCKVQRINEDELYVVKDLDEGEWVLFYAPSLFSIVILYCPYCGEPL